MTTPMFPSATLAVLAVVACNGASEDLQAVDDSVATPLNTPVEVSVLDNDLGLDHPPLTLAVTLDPVGGEAELVGEDRIRYRPNLDKIGADDFWYTIEDAAGRESEAKVSVDVACPDCMDGRNVRLSWDPNAPEDMVVGYRVYRGMTEAAEAMTMLDDLDGSRVDLADPRVVYDCWADLRLMVGDRICFRVTAYNTAGESPFSEPACATMEDSEKTDYVLSPG